ncbi:DNA adenine methylase [Acetivibrio clariflavus]|uniref:DNA adenine methylase n=1 Tax=Acetivibrio clariflavus TaxID=288965 RepID=UPI0031F5662D
MKYYSPLRYPGGKGKLANYIKLILSQNDLAGGTYVEPFAGGAGVAVALLLEEVVSKIIINDKNKGVYAFWKSVLDDTEDLCKLIKDTPVNIEEWKRQREIFATTKKACLELGFATFFLNRTNRSGILTGGVIGGLEQKGEWKIDARYNKDALINRIESIALRKKQIKVYNKDIFVFVDKVLPRIEKRTLVYFDPPYYKQGSSLYENHFKHEDHLKLANIIKEKVDKPWIITYDDTPEIEKIYDGYAMRKFYLNYSAASKYKGTEIMIYHEKEMIPSKSEIIKNRINIKFA